VARGPATGNTAHASRRRQAGADRTTYRSGGKHVSGILKFFGSVIGIIFLIGLVVVIGLLALIF
jgi:hypothetical protein